MSTVTTSRTFNIIKNILRMLDDTTAMRVRTPQAYDINIYIHLRLNTHDHTHEHATSLKLDWNGLSNFVTCAQVKLEYMLICMWMPCFWNRQKRIEELGMSLFLCRSAHSSPHSLYLCVENRMCVARVASESYAYGPHIRAIPFYHHNDTHTQTQCAVCSIEVDKQMRSAHGEE